MVSRTGMVKILTSLEGVTILHHPKFYDAEVFCEFEFGGHKFEITEPYGDSSTYDVVASESAQSELEVIAIHFEAAEPVKGGDIGQRLYFLANWFVLSWVIFGLGYGAWRGFKWIIS